MAIFDEMLFAAMRRAGHRPALQRADPFERAGGFRRTLPGVRSALALAYIERKRALLRKQVTACPGEPVLVEAALERALTRCLRPRPRWYGRALTSTWLGVILVVLMGAGVYLRQQARQAEALRHTLGWSVPKLCDVVLTGNQWRTLVEHMEESEAAAKVVAKEGVGTGERIEQFANGLRTAIAAALPADEELQAALSAVFDDLATPSDGIFGAVNRVNVRMAALGVPYYLDPYRFAGDCRDFLPFFFAAAARDAAKAGEGEERPQRGPGRSCDVLLILAYQVHGRHGVRVDGAEYEVTGLDRLDGSSMREPLLGKTWRGTATAYLYRARTRALAEDMLLAGLSSLARESIFPLGLQFDPAMQAHIGTLLGRSAEVVTGSEFTATQRAAQSLARSSDRLFASRVRQGTLRLGDESGGVGVGAASPAASGGGLALDALSTLALQRFLDEKQVIDHTESALLERATDKLAARLEQIVVQHEGIHLHQHANPPSAEYAARWLALTGQASDSEALARETQAYLVELITCEGICPIPLTQLYVFAIHPQAIDSPETIVAQGLLATLALARPPATRGELEDCTNHFVAVSSYTDVELHAHAKEAHRQLFATPPPSVEVGP